MKQLTKAEEQVMQILWDLDEGVIKEVVEGFEEPRPAYTTVATVLKVLEKKGFVDHKTVGNVHVYFPLVSKREYTRYQFSTLLKDYFSGSFPKLATFFAHENNLTMKDLEEMLKMSHSEITKEVVNIQKP
ncbi:MAG TPA: BlaI/MecI/CopY family transcriptional regulator [Prolixibacteraceae bacterium]|nr:BlaI/MecI/CopY family transcriptional regulator [Prolixibacteraceae bacterium]